MRHRFVEFECTEIEQSLADRFEQQVRRHSDRLAVKTSKDGLTYGELNGQANRIARAVLEQLGHAAEPVGLLFEQGAPLIAAILAVLKSGKFYVSIDASYPAAKITNMLHNSQARIVLTDSQNDSVARGWGCSDIKVVDVEHLDEVRSEDLKLPIDPGSLAYIFYTSGSTGRPKGVVDTQRNVLHNILRYTNSLRICAKDRFTLLQSCSFSGSVSSLFGALLNGAAVFPFDLRNEGMDQVAAWLVRERITVYHSVPSLFRHLATGTELFRDIRIIRLEGDQASSKDVAIYTKHFSDECVLVNGLGATECGLVRQYFIDKDTPVTAGALPLGYEVDGMEIRIVDEEGEELESGVIGEIAVSSSYLSPGYWQSPDLTARAFLPDPNQSGRRIYRTGDMGRMRIDGCLEYVGRRDSQRKVRGHHVDVAGVETALLAVRGIDEAVVEVREDQADHPRIVAYVVSERRPAPTVSELRRALEETLADYAVPGAYVFLSRLPLNSNGKVDRRALPAPGKGRPELDTEFCSPSTGLEGRIAETWAAVLDLDQVGIDDDFIDLGGDSLSALRLANQLSAILDTSLSMTVVFHFPTIRSLARHLQRGTREPDRRDYRGGREPYSRSGESR